MERQTAMRKVWVGATAIVVVAQMLSAMLIASARAQTAAAGWPHTVAMGPGLGHRLPAAGNGLARSEAPDRPRHPPQGATTQVLGTIELTVATTVDLGKKNGDSLQLVTRCGHSIPWRGRRSIPSELAT